MIDNIAKHDDQVSYIATSNLLMIQKILAIIVEVNDELTWLRQQNADLNGQLAVLTKQSDGTSHNKTAATILGLANSVGQLI